MNIGSNMSVDIKLSPSFLFNRYYISSVAVMKNIPGDWGAVSPIEGKAIVYIENYNILKFLENSQDYTDAILNAFNSNSMVDGVAVGDNAIKARLEYIEAKVKEVKYHDDMIMI